jgi:hypothetical protein
MYIVDLNRIPDIGRQANIADGQDDHVEMPRGFGPCLECFMPTPPTAMTEDGVCLDCAGVPRKTDVDHVYPKNRG